MILFFTFVFFYLIEQNIEIISNREKRQFLQS